jgi:hypothetical protein
VGDFASHHYYTRGAVLHVTDTLGRFGGGLRRRRSQGGRSILLPGSARS